VNAKTKVVDRDGDIWLDMDWQVMDGEIKSEDQSIVWITGLGLDFKRAPHMGEKNERNKKYRNSISHTGVSVLIHPSIHVSTLPGLATRPPGEL
jgi:hypothetical protein